jgi:transcriptional regulator with XRE-family HTH domain
VKLGLDVSERLIAWRTTHRYSRDEAAEVLGVSDTSLRHWESGRSCGFVGPLSKLMEALDETARLRVEIQKLKGVA